MTSSKGGAQQSKAVAEFDLSYPPNTPELYIDGISGLAAGWPISKLILHSRHPNQDGPREKRQVVALLTLPTATLIELCRNVLAAYAGTEDQIAQGNQQLLKTVQSMLKEVKRPPPPSKPQPAK